MKDGWATGSLRLDAGFLEDTCDVRGILDARAMSASFEHGDGSVRVNPPCVCERPNRNVVIVATPHDRRRSLPFRQARVQPGAVHEVSQRSRVHEGEGARQCRIAREFVPTSRNGIG